MHSDLSYLPRTSVYFKSSPPPFGAYGHQSADHNAFVISAGGERLAIESGYYGTYDGYNTNHWQWWVKRTKSKNAITFDGGKGQVAFEHQPNPYQITNARYGSITQQQSTADYDIVTGDATDAYAGALTKAVRSLVYLRPGTILLYDNLSSGTGRPHCGDRQQQPNPDHQWYGVAVRRRTRRSGGDIPADKRTRL